MPVLETPRLVLRGWRESDHAPFAALNDDPAVMEHFPSRLTRAESDAMVARIVDHFARHGFGLWAVEAPGAADFLGFVGLSIPRFESHFTPCVEIGWRLAREHWGRGYAPEAARAALRFGFEQRRARPDRVVHRAGEPQVAAGDGEDRDAPRSRRRLRSSFASRGSSAAPPRALPDEPSGVGAARPAASSRLRRAGEPEHGLPVEDRALDAHLADLARRDREQVTLEDDQVGAACRPRSSRRSSPAASTRRPAR